MLLLLGACLAAAVVAGLLVAALFRGDGEGEGDLRGTELSGESPTPTATATPISPPIALENTVFLVQSGDITILGPEGWSVLDVPEQVGFVRDVTLDDQGRLWVLGGDGLGLFDGAGWVQYPTEGVLAEAVTLDSHGQPWVGGYTNVSVLSGNAWTRYDFSMEQWATINDMAVDDQDRVWVATEEGLRVLDAGTWIEHDLGEEEAVPVDAVAVAHDGRVWAGHWHGVSVFDEQRWLTYGALAEVEVRDLHFVNDLTIDAEGALWAVTSYREVWVFRDGGWTKFDRLNSGYLGGEGMAISTDVGGRVWIGTEWHLTVFDGTQWVNYTPGNSELDYGEIEHVAVSGTGPAVLPEPTGPGVGTVTGRVTFNGESLPGAEVHVCSSVGVGVLPHFWGETPCQGDEYIATTGPDGRFLLKNVPMGRYGFVTRTPQGDWYLYGEVEFPSTRPHVHFNLDSGEAANLGLIRLGDE